MLNQLPFSRVPGAIFPAIPDTQASLQLALQYQLESSQWWNEESLLAAQMQQASLLLRHAMESVPYYRQLFRAHGIAIPDNVGQDFFRSLPISRRSAIQHAQEALQAKRLPEHHDVQGHGTTSGSTGKPVTFSHTAVTRGLWHAFAMRDHLWHRRDFNGKLGAIRYFPRGTAEAPAGDRHPNWGTIVAPIFSNGPSVSLNIVASLDQQIEWLQRERPDYLISFQSNLVALSRHARTLGIELPPVKELRTVGETVSGQARELLQQTWNAKVTDVYTCEEAGYLALQCPVSGHYHVQSENVILEVVDDDGNACIPGQTGHVLITTLHNFATPLIRYEVGDLAEVGSPCACGRGLPVLRKIQGRKRNRLVLPSGESLFPYLGEHDDIMKLTGVEVRQYQCVQHSVEEIEIRLVADREFTPEEAAKVAERSVRNLGHPFRVVFSFHEQLPRGAKGKFEEFVSHVA